MGPQSFPGPSGTAKPGISKGKVVNCSLPEPGKVVGCIPLVKLPDGEVFFG